MSASSQQREQQQRETHACAPSLNAIKGSRGQSLSAAGSTPSSTPNQDSTSGPLCCSSAQCQAYSHKQAVLERAYLAWWKPTTVTRGTKPLLAGAGPAGVGVAPLFSILFLSLLTGGNPIQKPQLSVLLPQLPNFESARNMPSVANIRNCSTHCAVLLSSNEKLRNVEPLEVGVGGGLGAICSPKFLLNFSFQASTCRSPKSRRGL
jgi:hypothetical protein